MEASLVLIIIMGVLFACGVYAMLERSLTRVLIGFLLLDERDENTLTALLVTPLPIGAYLAYRITLPLILGFVVTCVTYPLVGLAPISAVDLVVVAGLVSLGAPGAALFLAVFAENKITGLAFTKVLNAIGLIPVLAYFIQSDWQLLAGVLPAYWPMKVVWLAAAAAPDLVIDPPAGRILASDLVIVKGFRSSSIS